MLKHTLKQLREQHGLSQAQLAEQLRIPKGTYVTYEYGTREPNIEMINRLADYFQVTTDYLLGRDDGEPNTLDRLAAEYNLSAAEKNLLCEYLSLPDDVRWNLIGALTRATKVDG